MPRSFGSKPSSPSPARSASPAQAPATTVIHHHHHGPTPGTNPATTHAPTGNPI